MIFFFFFESVICISYLKFVFFFGHALYAILDIKRLEVVYLWCLHWEFDYGGA